jgi:hypothetical protein
MSAYIDKKYINMVSPQLQRFKWKSAELANCRCPLCGDSQRNKTKARGFFFPKKNDYFFKCHNCGIGHSMYRFLQFVAPALAQEYALERWRSGENGKSNYVKPDEQILAMPKADIRLPKIASLPTDHPAQKYLESRKVPHLDRFYFSNSFGDWVRSIDPTYLTVPNDERIVIPFVNKAGDLVAAQGRSLSGSKNAIRYITVKFCKDGRAIYGEDRLDYSRRVYAVEGPIDSVFLDNSIALAGCELAHATKLFSDCVIVYDNEPRNTEIVAKVQEAISAGYTVCVWSDSVDEKDINDMVLAGRTPQEVQKLIDECSCSGLVAHARFSQWRMR